MVEFSIGRGNSKEASLIFQMTLQDYVPFCVDVDEEGRLWLPHQPLTHIKPPFTISLIGGNPVPEKPSLPLPPPSKDFLAELLERAKRYGWSGDYVEIDYFLRSLYHEAGIDISDAELEPYKDDDE